MINKLAVIIPFYNQSEMTKICINSIISQNIKYKIILYLVDDGSDIEHQEQIKAYLHSKHEKVEYKYIRGDGTWWWAKSLNMGLKLAYQDGNELFLIINNDNRLGESNLKYLMRIFIDNNLDILGSIVVFKNDLIKHYGVTFNPNNGKIIHNLSTQNINNIYFSQEFIKTDSLGGQGVLINRNVINRLGYLDDKIFPQYGSDLDYYLRAKELGINIYITHLCKVVDDEDSTGLLKNRRNLSLVNFIRSFYSKKSHMSFSVKFNIYKRHVKNYFYIKLLFLYIKYIIRFFLRRL